MNCLLPLTTIAPPLRLRVLAVCLAIASTLTPGVMRAQEEAAPDQGQAQLFSNLGDFGRKIATESSEAQEYFDQGMTWMYSFNHDEAIRCFREAAKLDPHCPMPWWGISLASGPQYNHPVLTEERTNTAWNAMQKALSLIDNANGVERALIQALQHRNAETEVEDEQRGEMNQAYADAMKQVWEKYPKDVDVGTLYAESMMVCRPWQLYSLDGEPAEDTPHILEVLDQVIALAPNHPGALHYYIHSIEPSVDPTKGLFAADRLSNLIPDSGHMVHMPSHIYVQTGHWNRAIEQNEIAMLADDAYIRRVANPGVQYGYMVHNSHMLAYAAMMSGRQQEAMAAARDMWADLPTLVIDIFGAEFDAWMCSVYDVQKRFGQWQAILEEPEPPAALPITQATWRAARAVAQANLGDFSAAGAEYIEFKNAVNSLDENAFWGLDSALRVLEVSENFILGEIALRKGLLAEQAGHADEAHRQLALAESYLRKAVAVEDTLGYGEPPQWLQPVRHTLGGVYLATNQPEAAEKAYREDLEKWPNNVWSLQGLAQALEAQGKRQEAEQVQTSFKEVAALADFQPKHSCECLKVVH